MVACELSRRHPPEALRCPRCDSAETKFCYYNNYNTSQPRHFCKSCKRYWTAGGSLRNVPVGGGLRKNKKSKLLNQVKDMVSSSSPDELFHGSSLAANPPYAFAHDGLPYEAPRPLSFVPPLFMASPSSSADVAGDGNPYAFRNLNPVSYGYFAENRTDDYAAAGMDPSLVNSINMRQQTNCQADQGRALPMHTQRHWNGGPYGHQSVTGADQAQSHSGGVSEFPSEPSQVSSEVMKDVSTLLSTDLHTCHLNKDQVPGGELNKMHREESSEASLASRQQSVSEQDDSGKQENVAPAKELRHVEENQLRDVSSTEGEDDDLGNVVNVRYPYDWEQVSEVLFGGTPDFFQLSGILSETGAYQ